MGLAPGSKIGVYHVVSRLGAGGMGEVFRARDTTLDREVALKTLPPEFVGQAERVALFQREAKVLASLNHPNIGHIYGLETSTPTPVLVLELVLGETLAARLQRGRMPVDETLEVARQIVFALEAAHDQGVVHRDLKPGNVMMTPNGQVKVLDFGLAKTLHPDASTGREGSASSESPTLTRSSALGAIVGTAAYMSPEQARGRAVDRRADLWAFGVVLYEMLTGRRLFLREDTTETLAAVLRDEIDWSALPRDTPPSVTRLLRRCLERDPRRRLKDAGDARLELDESSAAEPGLAELRTAQAPGRTLRAAAAVVAVAMLSALAAWLVSRGVEAPARGPSRFAIELPADLFVHDLAVSPDGRAVAFSASQGAKRQIYLRTLDRLEPQPLAGTEDGLRPFFSPDSAWLAFETGSTGTGDAELRKLPLRGGPSVLVCRGSFRGGTWRGDGTIVLGSPRGLLAVAAAGGSPREVTRAGDGESHFAPQAVRGSEAVLFEVFPGSEPDARIEVVDLRSGVRRSLTKGTGPVLTRSGHLLLGRGGSLWGAPFDPKKQTLAGEPVRLIEHIDNSVRGEGVYAVSDGGDLFYKTPDTVVSRRAAAWVDLSGRKTAIPLPEHNVTYPRLSPDGQRLAYGAFGMENDDVWLFDLARSVPSRFTLDPGQDLDSAWMPSGREIIFHSHRDGAGNLYRQAANGTGAIKRLTAAVGEQVPGGVSADGRYLLVHVETKNKGLDLHLLDLDHPGETRPLLATPVNEASGEFSRDGRYIAYVSDESGRAEVYVRPFPDVNRDRWQVSSGGGHAPVFSRDGRGLFFATGGSIARVRVETAPAFRAGPVEKILAGPYYAGAMDERQYDVSPDGRRFLVLETATAAGGGSRPARLLAVLAWGEELRLLAAQSAVPPAAAR